MELSTIFFGIALVFFIFGLAFSVSVFIQYRKERKEMREKIGEMEKNLIWALEKLEWGEMEDGDSADRD